MGNAGVTEGLADPHLTLKATAPRMPRRVLERERLSSTCAQFEDRNAILVNAPGGFGKTSLLGQWRREWTQRGATVAWFTADARDEGPRFVQGLSVAMRQANSGMSSTIHGITPGMDQLDALTGWLADVAESATDTVLVLDDVHALPASTAAHALPYLLHNAPPNLTIAAAGRTRLDLPVHDLLARGRLATLESEQLRLRMEETMALLRGRFGARIDTDTCARLHEITEGWPLGLQLAMSTIERSASLADAMRAIGARSGDVEHFFMECLVRQMPPELSDFLTTISVTDGLTRSLCEALTGSGNAAVMLTRLRKLAPIFLEGENSEWLRIHPLARSFLLRRLQERESTALRELHMRAATWLEQQGMYEAASQQAFAAGEHEWTFDLAERCMYEAVVKGHISRVLDWVSRIPAQAYERRPSMRLACGWALALGSRFAQAVEMVKPLLADPDVPPLKRIEAQCAIATAVYFGDDIDTCAALVEPLAAGLPYGEELLDAIIGNTSTVPAIYAGEPERVRQIVNRQSYTPQYGVEIDVVSAYRYYEIGFSYLWEGRMRLAQDALEPALAMAERRYGRRGVVTALFAGALANAYWYSDRTNDALTVLANRLDVIEQGSPVEAKLWGYSTAARLAALQGDTARAHDLLEQLCSIGAELRMTRLQVGALGERIHLHAQEGHLGACRQLIDRVQAIYPLQDEPRPGRHDALVHLLALRSHANVAIVERAYADAARLLDRAAALASRLQRGIDDVEIKVQRALVSKRLGEADFAATWAEAVSIARSLDLRRVVLDAPTELQALAPGVASEPAGTAPAPPERARAQAANGLLTPKETDVLQLLARSMSNKQIANALGVGDETIKWHVKNLLNKLGGGTRRHAVDRARVLGILMP